MKHVPALPGVMFLHATYITQTFSRHSHEGFAVGVIEDGALQFSYRGETLVASPGRISLVNPDEPHDGHSATHAGWWYRMFYLDASVLQQAAEQVCGRCVALPFFQNGVLDDADLAGEIRSLHADLFELPLGNLEVESRMLHMLGRFIRRHADGFYPDIGGGREHQAVQKVKRMIADLYDTEVSLQDLAEEAGLSRFHLIRVFKQDTGFTPHGYLTQTRVLHARELIRRGRDLVDAALESGFVDQSHLNRHFKSIIGMTPGVYRNFLQDAGG